MQPITTPTTSKRIAADEAKVEIDITIMEHRYVEDFDSNVYIAQDNNGNLISFRGDADKPEFTIGQAYSINARIITTGPDEYSLNTINYICLEN